MITRVLISQLRVYIFNIFLSYCLACIMAIMTQAVKVKVIDKLRFFESPDRFVVSFSVL